MTDRRQAPLLPRPLTDAELREEAARRQERRERGLPLSAEPSRSVEIARAGDQCERCGWLAWSNERHAQLQLRPRINREGESVGSLVLCPCCAERYDGKHGRADSNQPQAQGGKQ